MLSLYSSSIRVGICAHLCQGVADLTKEMKKVAMAAFTPNRTKIQRFPFIVNETSHVPAAAAPDLEAVSTF